MSQYLCLFVCLFLQVVVITHTYCFIIVGHETDCDTYYDKVDNIFADEAESDTFKS
jgi:hypothetical protein